MEKQPATVTFKFLALEPTLADLKEKVQAVLNSEALAKKFDAEFPKDATARGLHFKTLTIGTTGTVSDTGGKVGGSGGGSISVTFG